MPGCSWPSSSLNKTAGNRQFSTSVTLANSAFPFEPYVPMMAYVYWVFFLVFWSNLRSFAPRRTFWSMHGGDILNWKLGIRWTRRIWSFIMVKWRPGHAVVWAGFSAANLTRLLEPLPPKKWCPCTDFHSTENDLFSGISTLNSKEKGQKPMSNL